MTKKEIKVAKRRILRALTEQFEYGTLPDGTKSKLNVPPFPKGKVEGWEPTNVCLAEVMDAVILGLYFAMADTGPGTSASTRTKETRRNGR